MEEKFKMVMDEYINSINHICDKLLEGINNLENLCLKSKKDFFDYREKNQEWNMSLVE